MTGQPTQGRRALAAWLVGHTRSLLPVLAVSVVARIAGQLLGVALLVMVASTIGRVAAHASIPVPGMVGALTGIALAKALLRYLEHYAGHWVAFTALARLREVFFARLIPQAPAATQGRAGAELTETATRDIDRIEVFFAHTLPPAVAAVIVPALSLCWLGVSVDGRLAVAIVPFVAAVVFVVPFLSGRSTWRAARQVAARRGALAARLGDDLQGVREVLSFGIRSPRLHGLDQADAALGAARSRAGRVAAVRTAALVALEVAGLVALVAVGAAAAVPVPDIVVALALAVALWGPARGGSEFAAGLDSAFAATARVRQVVEAPPVVRDSGGPPAPAPRPGAPAVAFEAVTFGYPGMSAPAVADVDVSFRRGSWNCVVGASGSGKSTLAALLLRGWDVEQGAVRLTGADVRDLPLHDLRRRVALVPQRPTALSGTLADNLRLARPDATDEALREAIAVVGLDSWVSSLPDGLATAVRERGLNLSGGQLQRLALARALVAAPEVLILDEALSQLDAPTARAVHRRLSRHRAGLTVIEITHRADLVADDVPTVVLDAGRVLEHGPAAELRASGGAFTRLEARGA
nr:ABC transporter ATP-binding protein [Propionicimonas sp.]